MLQLALGSHPQPKAKFALEIMLDVLHEEAHAFADANTSDPRGLAVACRLEALKEFVEEHLEVEWKTGAS